LEDAALVTVRIVTEDGSLTQTEAQLQEVNRRTIRVRAEFNEEIKKGVSGSSVLVKGHTAGMIFVLQGAIASAYREDVISEYWNRAMRITNPCAGGCETKLANLVRLKSYVLGDDPTADVRTVTYDAVYRLPEGWPFYPYLHVIRTQLKMFVQG